MKQTITVSYEDLEYEALLRIVQLADELDTTPKMVVQTVIRSVVAQQRALGSSGNHNPDANPTRQRGETLSFTKQQNLDELK